MIPYPQTIYLCDQFIIPYIKPLCFVKTMVLYRSPSCKKSLSKLSYQVASYWRADREAEGARLLSEYTPKAYLGFESPALRHLYVQAVCLKGKPLFIGFKLRKWEPTALQHYSTTTLATLRLCNPVRHQLLWLTMTALQLLALPFVLNTRPQHTPQPSRGHTRQPRRNEILQSARKFLN